MWVRIEQIVELGVSRATIFRKIAAGEWQAQDSKETAGKGRPAKELLLESLPEDLQRKFALLEAEKRESVDDASIESESVAPDSNDARIDAFVAALSRFSPPDYTLEQKESVQRRCLEMASLCDEVISTIAKLKRGDGISVASPGSTEAGPGRAYHPQLANLAARSACTDSIYTKMYPSSTKPLSVSTLLRLTDKYKTTGLSAFIRQTQTLSPAADDRFLEIPQEAINWLQANLKNYVKASVTSYGEKWLAWAKRSNIKLPFTEFRPSQPGTCYTWLYRWKTKVPSASMALARDGERKFDARFAIIVRDYSELRPRVGWTMDWRTSDVVCWLPFNKSKDKKPVLVREVVCSVFDIKARAVFGFHISNRPSSRGVTLAYVDALSQSAWKQEAGFEMLCGMQRPANGIDAFALWDNGKDFRSQEVEGKEIKVGKIELEDGLKGTMQSYSVGLAVDAQIQIRHAKPYNAKSKTVEPFHRYGIGLWEEGMTGFCGNKITEKPHFYAAAVRIHKSFMDGTQPKPEDLRQLPSIWRETYEHYKEEFGYGTPFLSQADFRARFTKRMVEYNLKPHGSLKNERGELSPVEYLNLYADAPHLMRESTIAALCMTPRVVTVQADSIRLQWSGEKFFYQEVKSDLSDGTALLRLPENTKVEVRYNPDNVGRALVMAQGAQLCWIENPVLMGWNASSEDFKRANSRKKQSKQVAKEFFNVQAQPSPDWRDEAEARMPKLLEKVVGGDDLYESPEQDNTPQAKQPVTPIPVITRYDHKSPDAPGKVSTGNSLLHVVPFPSVKDDFEPDLKAFNETDDEEEIKAGWEN
jgi:transposase InsO family protein